MNAYKKTSGHKKVHRCIVEKLLRRVLSPKHPVHHVDEDKSNNANSNLVVCEDQEYHLLLHRRAKALRESGDANKISCRICGNYDLSGENGLVVYQRHDTPALFGEHAECRRQKMRRLYQTRLGRPPQPNRGRPRKKAK